MDIIFFLFITVFFIFKLKKTLGIKNNDDKIREKTIKEFFKQKDKNNIIVSENVVDLTEQLSKNKNKINLDFDLPINIKNELIKINFNKENFLKGVETTLDMISDAFSNNNMEMLKNALSKDMFNNFENKLNELSSNNQILKSSLVSIISKNIENISILNKDIFIEVILKTEQINYIENNNKEIIFGDRKKINTIKEKWIFKRGINSKVNFWVVCNIISIK